MLTVIFWKKAWAWIKNYWHWPIIIILLIFSTVTGTRAKEKLFELLLKQRESYEKEIEVLNEVNKEKDLKKNISIEDHKKEIEKIEKEHDLDLSELEKEKQEDLVRTIEENKDKPEKLAKEISKILSAEYFKKNR